MAACSTGVAMGRPEIFAACVVMMSLQPLLINLAGSKDEQPLPPDAFILVVESLKVLLCTSAIACRRVAGVQDTLWCGLRHTTHFAVPATIYLVMNVLKVVSARALAPPLFQLLAATKILATAVASWLLLAKQITSMQWAALVLLTAGVSLGQHRDTTSKADSGGVPGTGAALIPVLIMLINSGLSAVAAVYTEKVLKAQQSSALSIFATNLHMALHTLLVNGVKLCVWEAPPWTSPLSLGWRTWVALGNEAVNGILVSTLMRHADSIVKNYAFSTSIFATAIISAPVLNYWPQPSFFAGAALVLASMGMYTNGGPSKDARKRA